jgi:hypothetical protein
VSMPPASPFPWMRPDPDDDPDLDAVDEVCEVCGRLRTLGGDPVCPACGDEM